jgi:hypothetical protein
MQNFEREIQLWRTLEVKIALKNSLQTKSPYKYNFIRIFSQFKTSCKQEYFSHFKIFTNQKMSPKNHQYFPNKQKKPTMSQAYKK